MLPIQIHTIPHTEISPQLFPSPFSPQGSTTEASSLWTPRTGKQVFPTACPRVKEGWPPVIHTGQSLQTKHAHLHAVHLGTRGQLLVSSASQTSEVMPQFPPYTSCLLLLTALSSPSCKILPGLLHLQRPEERLGYLR